MSDLARLGPRDGLDTGRPLPAGFVHAPRDLLTGEVDHVRLALALERPSLVRRLEVLDLHGSHCRSSPLNLSNASEPSIRARPMQRAYGSLYGAPASPASLKPSADSAR